MAASIAEGPSRIVRHDYESSASFSLKAWPQRVIGKVFRRRRPKRQRVTRMELKGTATPAAWSDTELLQALDLMGRPFDGTMDRDAPQYAPSVSVEYSDVRTELDPFSVPMVSQNWPRRTRGKASEALPHDAVTGSSETLRPASQVGRPSTRPVAASHLPTSHSRPMDSTGRTVTASVYNNDLVESNADGGSPLVRLTRPWVQSLLEGLLDKWSQGAHVNMNVHCHPQSKTLDLVQGRFACDASVDFDRIVFGPIRMHRGRIEVSRLALGLWSLTPSAIPIKGHRYLNQFEFYARNVTFTQEDLVQSKCIRNGLKNLLVRILKLQGTKAVRIIIEAIDILPNGKISCRGATKTAFGKILGFEVRCGLAFTSRGHILTFPGLEISLNPALGIFVPVLPDITLDLGHNAQLLDLDIDGKAAAMTVSARVTIAPHHTLKLNKYQQSQEAYLAQYSVDVGRWLTRLGNFSS